MAKTLKDIFLRRTGLGTLGNPGEKTIQTVANLVAELHGWGEEKTNAEIESLKKVFEMP
jgi:glycerol-3-phosphate dehydrogenase